jgi:nucleotide-binding universal stress UspA family protein
LLQPGAEISIITVDAKPTGDRHGEAPGHDVALYLARHGYKATVRNEDSLGADVVEVLLDVMHAEKTDLLVMGGYRHPRLQQSLFGGVTRSMLAVAETPLFLSH